MSGESEPSILCTSVSRTQFVLLIRPRAGQFCHQRKVLIALDFKEGRSVPGLYAKCVLEVVGR